MSFRPIQKKNPMPPLKTRESRKKDSPAANNSSSTACISYFKSLCPLSQFGKFADMLPVLVSGFFLKKRKSFLYFPSQRLQEFQMDTHPGLHGASGTIISKRISITPKNSRKIWLRLKGICPILHF